MSKEAAQIDWSAAKPADLVANARRVMQVDGRRIHSQGKPAAPDAVAPAVSTLPRPVVQNQVRLKSLKALGGVAGLPGLYALATLLVLGIGIGGVMKANTTFAPEMYAHNGMVPAAEAHAAGKNYAVFDLNLNIRRWREEAVARFTETPDVVVLGASHWQEAHSGLIRSETMYNGHVHRDYWEDLLGSVEPYVRNKQLPKRMIIAIRDKQFTPIEMRKDFLWEPGIPNYQAMADRLGLEKQPSWSTYPWQRLKERLSLTMLFHNVARWYNAEEHPHASSEKHFEALDTLLPDGSILWSAQHQAIFTPERAKQEALAFAAAARNSPPVIDPKGVAAFDKLLGYLKEQGVQVVLVHPPFNPLFYDAVQGSDYMPGLEKIRQLTKDFATRHGLQIIGDFDPYKVGCTSDQYIDAEHANPACLQKIFDQYEALLPQLRRKPAPDPVNS